MRKVPKIRRKRRKIKTPIEKLRSDLDKLWPKAVKIVWQGQCAVCRRPGNQSHHFFGKKAHPSVKYEINNGVWMCFPCHIRKTHQQGATEKARDALINKIGPEAFEVLKTMAYSGHKTTILELEGYQKALGEIIKKGGP